MLLRAQRCLLVEADVPRRHENMLILAEECDPSFVSLDADSGDEVICMRDDATGESNVLSPVNIERRFPGRSELDPDPVAGPTTDPESFIRGH
jgi:hypothetical protein